MAFKFTKAQVVEFEQSVEAATMRRADLDQAITVFNATVAEAFTLVEAARDSLNASMDEVRTLLDDHLERWRDELNEKSDRFRESDNGERAAEFIDGWETFQTQLDDLEIDEPEPLSVDLPDFEDTPSYEA